MPNQSGKIARGLRSIGLEMVKTAQTSKFLDTGYGDVTLSLYDQEGALKSTYEIMSDLYPTWQKMSDQQKSNLGITLAGKQQYEVFSATMEGFGQVLKANEVALSSQGSAMKENQAYMESMGAKLNLLKAQFEKLVLDGGVISKLIKAFLDLSISLLKFANTDLGGVIIGIGLTITSFLVLSKAIDQLLTRLALLSIGIQKEAIDVAIATGYTLGYAGSIEMLTASFQKFTATLATNPIGLIAIGLTVAIVGMVALHKHVTEVDTSLKDLHETTTGFKEELVELESSISAINSRLDEIKDKKLGITDQSQLDLLNQEQKALEQQLITAELLRESKKQEASKSSVKALNTKVTYVDTSSSSETENVAMEVTRPQGLSMTIDAMKEYEGTLKTLESEMANMEMTNQKDTSAYKEKASQVEELNKVIDAQKVAIPELAQQLSDEASQLDLSVDANKKLYAETQGVIDKSNEYMGVAEQKTNITEEDTEANEDNADSVQEQIDAHQALMDSTSDVLSSMEMLNEASQEQAENGELSSETAMKLIESGYAGALAYDTETNAVKLDAEATTQLLMAKLESAKAGLMLANSGLAGVILEEGRAAALAAQSMNEYAYSKSLAAIAGATTDMQENQKQLDLINQQLKDVEKNGLKGFGGVSKGAGGASKSVQTLEDKVKSATNYMKTMIDKEIKALREAKEAEEERVEAEIDALKERREAQEAYWDAKIEKVKKANEILEEQNKLQQLEQNLALAKSKKVKVFTGEGFEYKEDVDAVSKASQELSDYKREQQIAKEVETLEKLKKKALANIDKQIKGWEKYKKEMQKNFDAQIKALENYKDQLDDLTNGYKEQQDKLIAEQLLGAKLEQGNWQLRIDNLKKFVKEYNGELSGINTDVDTKGTEKSTDGSKAGMPSNIPKHASGSYAVPTDEIAIVGDSPNRELSIGSKLNMGGVMARLKGGTGVMPNTLTERLVNMAYNTNTSPTSNSNSSIININVDKVELPSVTNGKTFVNELLGLKTLAIQTSS